MLELTMRMLIIFHQQFCIGMSNNYYSDILQSRKQT